MRHRKINGGANRGPPHERARRRKDRGRHAAGVLFVFNLGPIDDDLLVDCFGRLEGQTDPGRVSFRYIVALLLMRRKRFRFEGASLEDGQEVLRLCCARTGAQHEVLNPALTDEEMAAVQEEVLKVLGWE